MNERIDPNVPDDDGEFQGVSHADEAAADRVADAETAAALGAGPSISEDGHPSRELPNDDDIDD